jgi:hypothetical protein
MKTERHQVMLDRAALLSLAEDFTRWFSGHET